MERRKDRETQMETDIPRNRKTETQKKRQKDRDKRDRYSVGQIKSDKNTQTERKRYRKTQR